MPNLIPDDTEHFIVAYIDSIAELEAILFFEIIEIEVGLYTRWQNCCTSARRIRQKPWAS